jgi:hypothetical protein
MVMRLSEREQKETHFSSNPQQQTQLFILMKRVSGSANLVAAGLGITNAVARMEK